MVPSLPPYYFEVIVVNGVVSLVVVMMNGWGVLQVLFVSFTKGPGGFTSVFIITVRPPTDTNRWHHFGRPWGLCPWGRPGGSWWCYTFEVSLDPIPATDLFDTFTKTLCVGYDYVTLTLNFSGGSRGTVSTLVVNLINGLTGRPVEPFLHLAIGNRSTAGYNRP